MKEFKSIKGVMPIIPTPFLRNEDIDEAGLRSLVRFAIDGGVKAACLPAYASEFYKLTDDEKIDVVKIAVDEADGALPIVGQCNHASLRQAIKLAQSNVEAGVDAVAIAVPRMFSLPESSIKDYLGTFMSAVPDTPVLVQDFNPGGTSISVELISELLDAHANFKYLKLEEPLCAAKFDSIIQSTNQRVDLFEGWGGLYMLELIPIGITGVMPGLAVSDFLQKVFDLRKAGEDEAAFRIFEKVMPQIFFALQNMELFHYAEKELLVARGVLKEAHVRKVLYTPDEFTKRYIRELNNNIVDLAESGVLETIV